MTIEEERLKLRAARSGTGVQGPLKAQAAKQVVATVH